MTFFLVNIPREGEENRQLFTVLRKERKNWILRRAARECARDISPTEREEEEKPSEGSSSNPSSSRSAQSLSTPPTMSLASIPLFSSGTHGGGEISAPSDSTHHRSSCTKER